MIYPWAKRLLTFFLGALLLFAAKAADAQEAYQGLKPSNNVFVYDYADILNDGQEQQLNRELVAFKDTTSNVIIVVTHPDLFGEAPWRFATDLGQAWGVGKGDKDNGLVMVIKPKTASSRGEAFIATGYGLEGAIPDITANRIVDGEMIPRFKQEDYPGGIYAGVQVLKQLAAGEIKEYAGPTGNSRKAPWGFLFIIFFGVLTAIGSSFYRVHRYARVNDMAFWAAWALMAQSGRSHGGAWNSFSGGSSGFGGGGGFGGFGGGGFGGGGAGGSW